MKCITLTNGSRFFFFFLWKLLGENWKCYWNSVLMMFKKKQMPFWNSPALKFYFIYQHLVFMFTEVEEWEIVFFTCDNSLIMTFCVCCSTIGCLTGKFDVSRLFQCATLKMFLKVNFFIVTFLYHFVFVLPSF